MSPKHMARSKQDQQCKQSLYFPESMRAEIQDEAKRQDRSLSWVMQRAWRIARARIVSDPAPDRIDG